MWIRSGFVAGMLTLITSGFAQTQWECVVFTPKGTWTRSSDPHPLNYWTSDPVERGAGYKTQTETTALGTIRGYQIVQILKRVVANAAPPDTPAYRFPPDYRATTEYKMLLVRVGADRYREIYHLENEGQMKPLGPARIVTIETESVLATFDPAGGNDGFCTEGYWTFNESGPSQLNFEAVDRAIRSAVPENTIFNPRCGAINLEGRKISTGVQRADGECRVCGWLGNVTAGFVIRGALVEPTTVEFAPN